MRREKILPAIKRKTVTEIETGRLSQGEAAKRLNVGRATIQGWLSKYRSEGSSGLESNSENRIYSVQAKQQAVKAYLTGKYSQQRICEIFKIRDRRQLRNWLKVYNSGKEFKQMSGGSRMKSTHKATKRRTYSDCKGVPGIREQLRRDSQEVWCKLPASPHMDAEIQGTGRSRARRPPRPAQVRAGATDRVRAGTN